MTRTTSSATGRRRTPPPDAWLGPQRCLRRAMPRARYALATHEPHGVWGGLAEDDRRQSVADGNRRSDAPRWRPQGGPR
jgi:hypothetical protein